MKKLKLQFTFDDSQVKGGKYTEVAEVYHYRNNIVVNTEGRNKLITFRLLPSLDPALDCQTIDYEKEKPSVLFLEAVPAKLFPNLGELVNMPFGDVMERILLNESEVK